MAPRRQLRKAGWIWVQGLKSLVFLVSLCLQGKATDVLIRKVEADGMATIHLKGEGNERDKLV